MIKSNINLYLLDIVLTSRFLTKYEKAIQINNGFEVFVEVPNE